MIETFWTTSKKKMKAKVNYSRKFQITQTINRARAMGIIHKSRIYEMSQEAFKGEAVLEGILDLLRFTENLKGSLIVLCTLLEEQILLGLMLISFTDLLFSRPILKAIQEAA